MNRFAKIKNIAVLNKETFKKDSFPNIIKYLDTGSLTKNKIEGFQRLNTKSEKIPSRAQRKVFTNTILYSTVRPNQEHYGILERNFKDIVVSTGFTTIDITDENTYPKYIYYLLTQKSITDYLHTIGMNAVSSYPSISPDDIGNLKFRLPDLPTQKSIAKVLSDLDNKIELNNRINRELEAMAKTLYDYWFVQFDFPNEQGKPYKSSGGKMVYNAELKREIPVGWAVGYLNDLYDFQYGLGNTNPDNGGIYPIYGSNGVIGGFDKFNNEDSPVIGHIGANCGSIIYAHGKHYVTYNGIMCKVKYPFDKFFGYCTLLSKDLMSRRRGSTQPFISYDLLHAIDFIIPDKAIMAKFNNLIVPSYEQVIVNIRQNQQLTELRDWLLPMLMNGQVTVIKEGEDSLNNPYQTAVLAN